MRTININDFVKVILTTEAKIYLLKRHTEFCLQHNIYLNPPTFDEDGFYRVQMWQLIDEFKDFKPNTFVSPYKDCKIYLLDENIKEASEGKI